MSSTPVFRCPTCGVILKGKGSFCPVCKKGNRMKKSLLVLLLVLAACSALNTKPAVAAVGGMEIAFKSNSEAFKKFVGASKMSEEFRSLVLNEINKDVAAFEEMRSAHTAWTDAASSVNVEEVLKRLASIYKLVKDAQ